MDFAQKRNAIEMGLMPFLNDEYLHRALQIWEEKYSQQPTFALQRFIAELCNTAALHAQRSQILQSVIRSLTAPQEMPKVAAPAQVSSTKEMIAASAEVLACFSLLVETLINRCPEKDAIRLRLYLLENLPKLPVAPAVRRALHAWLSQLYTLNNIPLEVEAMRHLVNLTYIALCEYFGPIQADRLMHESVIRLETQHPEWPVRKLL